MKLHFKIYYLIIISFLCACTQNKVAYNPPEQQEYINRWSILFKEYESSANDIVKAELIEKCTQLFKEHKSVTNWKGQVKEINSYDDYAQLVIAHMKSSSEKSAVEFQIKINKNSACYNLLKTLKVNDEIVFSGTIDDEVSITGHGKITEPELLINCTEINGVENTLVENTIDNSNSATSNSSSVDVIVCKVCNNHITDSGYNPELLGTNGQSYFCSLACAQVYDKNETEKWNTLLKKYGKGEIEPELNNYNKQRCTQCTGYYSDGFCVLCGAASAQRVNETYSKAPNCEFCGGAGYTDGYDGKKLCISCRGNGKQTY